MRYWITATLAAALVVAPASAATAADRERSFSLGGRDCTLIAVPHAAPFGSGRCEGVRPGGLVRTDLGYCTLNFVFRGKRGRRYVGTAGHCILEGEDIDGEIPVAEQRWDPGAGPVARDADDKPIGKFVYAVFEDPKDFALIRLRRKVRPNPQMCHFGGPTGINGERPAGVVPLNQYGNGLGVGDLLPARTEFALGMPDPDHVFSQGAAAWGDSGGPVTTTDGRAVGLLVTGGVHVSGAGTRGVDAGVIGITRLGPQLDRASQSLGERLRLQTAPRR
jgi:hypothetical protein